MASLPPLGEVSVEVSGDIDKLLKAFAEGQAATAKFDKKLTGDLSKSSKKATSDLDRLGDSVARLERKMDGITRSTGKMGEGISDISQLGRRAQKDLSQLEKRAHSTGVAIGAFVGFLGAQAVGSFVRLTRETVKYYGSLRDMAAQLDISAQFLQVWHYGAKQAGLSTEEANNGIEGLRKTLGEAATGSKKDIKVLETVGFKLKEIKSGALTAQEALPRVADFIAKVGNSADRAAVLAAVFGQEIGPKLEPLLRGGSKGMDALRESAERLGIVLSDEQLQRADETAEKLEDVKTVLSANIAQTVAQNSTAIIGLANALGNLAGGIMQFLNSNPQEAFRWIGLIGGALLGGRIAGPIGAAVVGAAGWAGGDLLGQRQAAAQSDASQNVRHRTSELWRAIGELRERRQAEEPTSLFRVRRRTGSINSGTTVREAEMEVSRQAQLLQQARTAATTRRQQGPEPARDPALAFLNAPAGRAPRARRERQPRDTTNRDSRREEAYQRELMQLQNQYLRLQEGLTTDLKTIGVFQKMRIDNEESFEEEQIKQKQIRGEIGGKQAEELLKRNAINFDLEREAVDRKTKEGLLREEVQLTESGLQNQMDILSAQEGLANSTRDRKEIALEMVKIEDRLERLALDAIIRSDESSEVDKDIARQRLKIRDSLTTLAIKTAEAANRDPWQEFLAGLPVSQRQIQDRLDQKAVDHVTDQMQRSVAFADNFANAFGRALDSARQLKDPLTIVRDLVTDMADLFTQEFLIRPAVDWVRKKAGAPIAEKLIGAPADESGLTQRQLNLAVQDGTLKLTTFSAALQQATLALQSQAVPGVSDLGSAAMSTTGEFGELDSASAKAANALTQILSSVGAGGGAGGGLSGIMSIAGSLIGSAFGGGGKLSLGGPSFSPIGSPFSASASSTSTLLDLATVGKYADGGWVSGYPGRDKNLAVVSDEEFIVNPRAAKNNKPLLEAINSNRLGGDALGLKSLLPRLMAPSAPSFSVGDIHVHGAGGSDRDKRQIGKQLYSEVRRAIADGAKQGF